MTEQINDQISAFLDDELSDEQAAFLIRRFERDTDAREQAIRYTLIGAALRNELLEPDPGILRRRIALALTGGAPLPVARPARASARWRAGYWRPLAGVGIAATVAVAAIVGLRAINDSSTADPGAVSAAPLQTKLIEPPSYVVPQEVAETPAIAPAIRLTNYIVHHSEYASRLSRTSVRSNVVGAAEAEHAEAVEPDPAADTE